MNRNRVQRLMREDNLLCLRKRKFVVTTDSDHGLRVYRDQAEARLRMGQFIEGVYNEKRLHSALDCLYAIASAHARGGKACPKCGSIFKHRE